MKSNNILITGIPRSGTSLITKLISLDENNICFSEPTFIKEIKAISKNKKEILYNLSQKIFEIRNSIRSGKPLEFRVGKDDQISDNYFTSNCDHLIREKTSKFKDLILPKKNNQNKIFIKNNLLFTSCIAELSKQYEMIAVIRNPISIIQSWQSLDLPISKGVVTSGIKYSSSLNKILGNEGLLMKQIKIIDWFHSRYLENNVTLIKYEDLIENPCELLNYWIDKNTSLPLLNTNNNKHTLLKSTVKLIRDHSYLYKTIYTN